MRALLSSSVLVTHRPDIPGPMFRPEAAKEEPNRVGVCGAVPWRRVPFVVVVVFSGDSLRRSPANVFARGVGANDAIYGARLMALHIWAFLSWFDARLVSGIPERIAVPGWGRGDVGEPIT